MKGYKFDEPVNRPAPFKIRHSNRYEIGGIGCVLFVIATFVGFIALLVLNYPG